jgi:hypothetical protein
MRAASRLDNRRAHDCILRWIPFSSSTSTSLKTSRFVSDLLTRRMPASHCMPASRSRRCHAAVSGATLRVRAVVVLMLCLRLAWCGSAGEAAAGGLRNRSENGVIAQRSRCASVLEGRESLASERAPVASPVVQPAHLFGFGSGTVRGISIDSVPTSRIKTGASCDRSRNLMVQATSMAFIVYTLVCAAPTAFEGRHC